MTTIRDGLHFIRQTISADMAASILLLLAVIAAMALANSDWQEAYVGILHSIISIRYNEYGIVEDVRHWINDGLMALFFMLLGMEIKREIMEERLSAIRRATLPLLAAAGGVVAPALVYAAVNFNSPETLSGWAIPAATDVAFALGVLAFLGKRMPADLRVVLLAIAVVDDLAAILIIAVAYSGDLVLSWLVPGAAALLVLGLFNWMQVKRIGPYMLVGIVLWVSLFASGLHATLAGVIVALTIPLDRGEGTRSALRDFEQGLHPWVAFGILPLFALANAGVSFEGLSLSAVTGPVFTGIVLGLVVGKQVGIMGATWIAVKTGFCDLPRNVTWRQFYGMSALTGIGFTMSLFIGELAFAEARADVRLGVLLGSLISAVLGWSFLRFAAPDAERPVGTPEAEQEEKSSPLIDERSREDGGS